MRADMGRAYDVLWDGVNDGADGDLLDVTLRVTVKQHPLRPPAPAPRVLFPHQKLYDVILRALPARREDAVCYDLIASTTRFTAGQVNSALYRLRQLKLVDSLKPARRPGQGREPVRRLYWRLRA